MRRSRKLKKAKVVPVKAGATGKMTKNHTEILKIQAIPMGAHLVVVG